MLNKNASYLDLMVVSCSRHYNLKQINPKHLYASISGPEVGLVAFVSGILCAHQMRGRYQLDRDANTQLIPFNRWRTWPYSHEPDAQVDYNPSIDVSFSTLKLYAHILIQSYIDIGLIYASTDFFFFFLFLSCLVQLRVTPTLWPLRVMRWTITEPLLSEYHSDRGYAFIFPDLCVNAFLLTMRAFPGPN